MINPKPLCLLAVAAVVVCLVRHGHHLRRDQKRAHDDQELDQALADSFPASDPPAMTGPAPSR